MKNNTGHNLTDTQKALKAIVDAIENYQNQKRILTKALQKLGLTQRIKVLM